VSFEGPVAPFDVPTGKDLKLAVDAFERSGGRAHGHPHDREKMIQFNEVIDFEDLNYLDADDELLDQDDEYLGDSGDEGATEEKARRDARAERRKALEKHHREEKLAQRKKERVRDEGEPFERTWTAPDSGYYRFCVQATWNAVTAEVDVRKQSELGGLDEEGNVWTYEEKQWMEEEKLMEEDTAQEEGIKDEDFESTKEKLKTLRRLLADIQTKQLQERHKLVVHAATNEHSHSRMVLGSLLETIFFMVITGVQIYTIRRWFKGAPVLG